MKKYSVIDLFAGAGGLSLGFTQTGAFDIKVAFENNPCMQETYRQNHPGVDVRGDVCVTDYSEIQEKYGPVDVVIGGPPCQGFSNANRQKNHAINQNNMLVKQYIRAITELRPKAFVMENVSMLRSDTHRSYKSKGDKDIVEKYGIPTEESVLLLLDEKYYFDGVLEIITDRNKIEQALWPEKEYSVLNIIYKAAKNPQKLLRTLEKHKKTILQTVCTFPALDCVASNPIDRSKKTAFSALKNYYEKKVSADDIIDAIEPGIMLQRMLGRALEIIENGIIVERYNVAKGLSAVIKSFAVFDYLVGILGAEDYGYVISNNVLCAADYGAPQKRMRFVVMGIQKKISDKIELPTGEYDKNQYRTVRDAIEDLQEIVPFTDLEDEAPIPLWKRNDLSDLANELRDSLVLRNHLTTKTTDVAMKRFRALKQGENFHALSEDLKSNTYTDVSRTQNTIYLRLAYDEPCGTVVNVRKSMWIHPVKDRAISIREAARLQTFPDSFIFYGTKDKQYQQVGNAVPPIMAKAIAKELVNLLQR